MERTKVTDILKSFEYGSVRLMPSLWKGQRDRTIELYLSIDVENLLQKHLRHIGMKTEGYNGLPGWGSDPGQVLGAYSKMYCVTGDHRLKMKAIELFERYAELADEHPGILTYGTYEFDKMIGGMLDLYEYMGYRKAEKYIRLLNKRAVETFDRSIPRDGLQDHRMKGQIEWYTLPEQLFRAYQLFGDEEYLEHANAWLYDYMWNKVLNHDFKIGPRHAYSHVNCLSSAARAYEVTGDKKYLDIMTIAYEELTQHHCYATGGYGPGENLFVDKEGYLGFMLESPWDLNGEDPTFINLGGQLVARSDAWGSTEVSCCAWAVFKFSYYLMRHTGEAKYGTWCEQFLINCCAGQPDIKPNGELLYYAQYFADGGMKCTVDRRMLHGGINFQWVCCSGTWPQDVCEYSRQLYYHKERELYVAQYVPSQLTWAVDGTPVQLEMFGDFPKGNKVNFRVSAPQNTGFALKLRIPQWATGRNTLTINGEKVDVAIIPNEWLTIEREWQDDIITLEFEYKLVFKPVDEKRSNLCALLYGPIVLVSTEMTVLSGDVEHPEAWIKPVEGEVNTFRTLPGNAGVYDNVVRTFVPYYTYPEDKWYFMYNRFWKPQDKVNKWQA